MVDERWRREGKRCRIERDVQKVEQGGWGGVGGDCLKLGRSDTSARASLSAST